LVSPRSSRNSRLIPARAAGNRDDGLAVALDRVNVAHQQAPDVTGVDGSADRRDGTDGRELPLRRR